MADLGLAMDLNPQQRRAAAVDDDVHVIVRAGAGTGKTRTLIARCAHLIREGVRPDRIALMTFTRRAAREMVDRLEDEVGERADSIFAGTFHAFCLGWMRKRPRAFRAEDAIVIDRDDAEQLMKLCRGDHVAKGESFPKAGKILSYHSYARNTNAALREYLETYTELGDVAFQPAVDRPDEDDVVDTIVRIVDSYEQRKRECGYLDFDDLLDLFAKRLEDDDRLLDEVQASLDHVLVDEMQDTNPVQWRILDALRDPPRLYCVGDEAQSIYAFRGADFANVHRFTDRVEDGIELKLERNYRSQQPILDLANWLLADSHLDYDKELVAHRDGDRKPKLHEFDDAKSEAQWLAEDILRRVEEDDAEFRDHMICARTMWAARSDIEPELARRDIPYVVIGGISVFQTAHVKDLMAAIKAARSLDDQLAWSRYLTMFYGVGDVTANRMLETMRSQASVKAARRAFLAEFEDHREILKGPTIAREHQSDPAAAVEELAAFLDDTQKRRYDEWDKRKRDYELLADLAADHDDLREFVETYTLDPLTSKQLEERDRDDVVTLITIHSAKGTEAPTVYIPKARPGMFPHSRSVGDEEAVEEERRILYVAMTRAEDDLVLSRPIEGFADGPYFLDDMPEELVDRQTHGFPTDLGGFQKASQLDSDRSWFD